MDTKLIGQMLEPRMSLLRDGCKAVARSRSCPCQCTSSLRFINLLCDLNGSHRLKSCSYQVRNLKDPLAGPSADLYFFYLLKLIAYH